LFFFIGTIDTTLLFNINNLLSGAVKKCVRKVATLGLLLQLTRMLILFYSHVGIHFTYKNVDSTLFSHSFFLLNGSKHSFLKRHKK